MSILAALAALAAATVASSRDRSVASGCLGWTNENHARQHALGLRIRPRGPMSTLVTEREMSTHPLSSEGVVAPRGCFERLLVPVDFSPASRAALQVAGDLSARYGSEIVVFNAAGLDQNDAFLNSTGVPWGRGDVVRDVREHLRRFTETVLGPGAERVALVDAMDEEDVVRAVAVACVRNHATLLVIGTRTDDARRWRRSAAERIARSVAVPVLTVPVEPSAASRAPFD